MMTAQCPACGVQNDVDVVELPSARGRGSWGLCGSCRAYFSLDAFDVEAEQRHGAEMAYAAPDQVEHTEQFKSHSYRLIVDLAAERTGDPRAATGTAPRWLDVGCGRGGLLKAARARGYDVEGVDIQPASVAALHAEGLPGRVAASITELDVRDVDVVSVIDTNVYWPDQMRELGAIRAVLRPDGVLVTRTTNKNWIVSASRVLGKVLPGPAEVLCRRSLNDHRFSQPAASFLRVLRDAGFDVADIRLADAYYSDETSRAVKVAFRAGQLVYNVSKRVLSPGLIVVAQPRERVR